MLHNISWGQYLSILLILILIYYVAYFIKYYQDKLVKRLEPHHDEPPFMDEGKHTDEEHDIEALEIIVNEIREYILEKAGNPASKEMLSQQLESYVVNFNGLHKPAFRYALTNYIIQQAQIKCGVVFEEEELEAIWEKLSR